MYNANHRVMALSVGSILRDSCLSSAKILPALKVSCPSRDAIERRKDSILVRDLHDSYSYQADLKRKIFLTNTLSEGRSNIEGILRHITQKSFVPAARPSYM